MKLLYVATLLLIMSFIIVAITMNKKAQQILEPQLIEVETDTLPLDTIEIFGVKTLQEFDSLQKANPDLMVGISHEDSLIIKRWIITRLKKEGYIDSSIKL